MIRKLILLIAFLACLALPLGHLAAQEPAAPQAAESEPNDTIATADPVALGNTTASLIPFTDTDYFRLSLNAGQRVYVAGLEENYDPSYVATRVEVYDAAGNLVAEPTNNEDGWPGNHVLRFIAPATGNFFVRVTYDGHDPYEDPNLVYTLLIRNVPADEPDDSFEPVAAAWDTTIDSALFAPYDFDWYTIHARAGDVFRLTLTLDTVISDYAEVYIENVYPYYDGAALEAPGTTIVTYAVPFESDYIVSVRNQFYNLTPAGFIPQPYHLTIEHRSLYVAAAKAGSVSGVAYGPNDVLARNAAGAWRMVFDGEDVGLTKPLGGVEFMDDGSLLLSLSVGQTLPGLGLVQPTDVVRFVPTQLGANTHGAFSYYLRGAQSGLTTQGERIDAIALIDDGRLMVSTYGSAVVPKFGGGTLSSRDEDLLLFHANGPMPAAGTWEMRMDGTESLTARFSTNDVRAATIVRDYDDTAGFAHLLFAADRSYRYEAWDPAISTLGSFKAAPGDMIWLEFYEHGQLAIWPPIRHTTTLAFPGVISSVSVGPSWE